MKLNYAIASDRGLVRGNNEDSAYAGPYLLALSDGMGGHAAGEIASQIMINKIKVLDADIEDNDMLALLGSVADDGNREIARHMRENPATQGMGTTLTALLFDGSNFGLLHLGDSRGYRLRDGKLSQITVDDTLVQHMVDEGQLAPEDVSTHPRRSLLLKAYDGHKDLEPRLETFAAKIGDRYLLCSDGLSDPVTHSTIEEALRTAETPQVAADRLVELALRSGGPDNVTVVVADVVKGASESIVLPTTPVTAGALNSNEPEKERPNTAAGRAAVMSRTPLDIRPAEDAAPSAESADKTKSEEPAKKSRSRTGIAITLVLAAVLLSVAAGAWWINTQVAEKYFVTTHGDGAIIIEQGVNYSVVGKPLHQPYQATCLDNDGRVSLLEAAALEEGTVLPEGCALFTDQDLAAADREKIAGLTPGTYDEVMGQIQWLAGRALPVCVTRTPAEDTATDAPKTPETPAASSSSSSSSSTSSSTPSSTTTSAEAGDRARPGVDCRQGAQ